MSTLEPMPVEVMGGGESRQAPRGPQHREVRQSVAMPNRLPIPDHSELERRFTKVLVSVCVCLSICVSPCLSVSPSLSPSVCLSVSWFVLLKAERQK